MSAAEYVAGLTQRPPHSNFHSLRLACRGASKLAIKPEPARYESAGRVCSMAQNPHSQYGAC